MNRHALFLFFRNSLAVLTILLFIASCKNQYPLCRNSALIGIDTSFHAQVSINADTFKSSIYGKPELTSILRLKNPIRENLEIMFTDVNEMTVRYQCPTGSMEKRFKGKFDRKGRFVFFHSKKRIEIPPIIPILYSQVDWDRVRISLTPDRKYMHVQEKWNHSGNILLLGAGNIGDSKAVFSIENK